jgi:hypothetical protein
MAGTHTAFRLTDDDLTILDALQAKTGINRTDVVRLALRKLAEAEGIQLPKPKKQRRN